MFDTVTFWIMFSFSLFYAFSLTMKLSIIGFERFWHRKAIQHRYDFFNVYALIISELLYLFVWRGEWMERVVITLSLARMFRLCVYITPLKQVYFIIERLLPTYWQMFLMLCLIDWIFIVIGKLAFGGMIYNTNPLLARGAFEHAQFWELNFNDFVGGYTTLFSLQIVNNWYVISAGYTQITGTLWCQGFFISYFVVVNLIVLNILLALILDCTAFISEELQVEEETEGKVGDDLGHGDLEQLAIGVGAHSAEFMLRKVLCTDAHTDYHYHVQHPDLPTPRTIGGADSSKDAPGDSTGNRRTSSAMDPDEEYGTFAGRTASLHLLHEIEEGTSSPSKLNLDDFSEGTSSPGAPDIPDLSGLTPASAAQSESPA